MRTSPVYYIAPSAISIVPNCNGTPSDLAVTISRGVKIKVYCPRAGIDKVKETGEYQEWALAGRNRRLADSTKPYTIYARLPKSDKTKGYVVFSPMTPSGDVWIDKHLYLDPNTPDGLADLEGAFTQDGNWWVKLGDVSLPDANNQRTVTLDTGILGTEQFNDEWALRPDELPLRIELGCTINDEDAGPTPYVHWGQSLVLTAMLTEGWTGTDIQRFDRWEIVRNSGDAAADNAWNYQQSAGQDTLTPRQMPDGQITLQHIFGGTDDFNGAVAVTFTILAVGHNADTQQREILKTATINIMAETVATYELEQSAAAVTYNPRDNTYSPSNVVTFRIRTKAQDGSVSFADDSHIALAQLRLYALPEGDAAESRTRLTFTGGIATLPVTAFADGKSINLWLENGAQVVLARTTVAYIRYGEKGDTPISIYRWYKVGLTPLKPTSTSSEEPAPAAGDATGAANVYPTDKWSKAMPDRPATGEWNLWQCNSIKHGNGTIDTWSNPVRISGDKGTAGEDGSDHEYIYIRKNTYPFNGTLPANITTPDASSKGQTVADDDFVPVGWSDTAIPADNDNRYVYMSVREKPAGEDQPWGPFGNPTLWSNWGVRGTDGDGVEHVFIRTKNNVPPIMDSIQTEYASDEFRPTITSASQEASLTEQAQTTDDPKGPDSTYPYEWVATRSKGDAATDGTRQWTEYTGKNGDYTMSLWSRWAEDGEPATTYRLVPSASEIIRSKDGSFSPESLTCYCTSLKDGTATDNPSGATMQYSYDGSSWTVFTSSTSFAASTIYAQPSKKLYLRLLVDGKVMDKETVPVVEDGQDGVTYRIAVNPESITIPSASPSVTVNKISGNFFYRKGDGEEQQLITNFVLWRKDIDGTYTHIMHHDTVGGFEYNGPTVISETVAALVVCLQHTLTNDPNVYFARKEIIVQKHGDKGDDGYGLALTPASLIFEEKLDSSNNPYIDYANNTVSAVVYKGKTPLTPVVTPLTSPGSYTDGLDMSAITASGGTVTIGQGSIPGTLSSGFFTVNINADGGAYDRDVRIDLYVNRLGSWRSQVIGDAENSIAQKITYLYDESNPNRVVKLTTYAEYVRSSSQNIASLQSQMNGKVDTSTFNQRASAIEASVARRANVNLLPGLADASGWECGVFDMTDTSFESEGYYVRTPLLRLAEGAYTFSCAIGSDELTGYVSLIVRSQDGTTISSGELTGDMDGQTRLSCQFSLGSTRDVYLYVDANAEGYDFMLYKPKLEYGTTATAFNAEVVNTESMIRQTADNITLSITNKLGRTGIDIQNGTVNLFGDRVTFSDASGTVKDKVWIDSNNGTLHAVDGVFSGVVYATSGVFSGLVKKTRTVINSLNISNFSVETDFGTVFDFEKAGTYILFSDLSEDVYMYLPGIRGNYTNYTNDYKERARSLIGNKCLVYNKSDRNINISGHAVKDGIDGSFDIASNELCFMECKIRGYEHNDSFPTREGYEDIYWDCKVLKID